MSKVFLASLAMAAGLLTGSLNADLYSSECCSEARGLEGFYVGGNLGALGYTSYNNDIEGFLVDNSSWSAVDTGFTGGGTIGYNYVCNNAIFGVVGDFNGVSGSHTIRNELNDDVRVAGVRNKVDWFSTIRLKAGLTISNAQLYITGGAAVAKFNHEWFDEDGSGDLNIYKWSKTRWGWAVGAGVEYNFSGSFSFGGEFLALNFDNHLRLFGQDEPNFVHAGNALVGRVFVNYYFDDLFSCCR